MKLRFLCKIQTKFNFRDEGFRRKKAVTCIHPCPCTFINVMWKNTDFCTFVQPNFCLSTLWWENLAERLFYCSIDSSNGLVNIWSAPDQTGAHILEPCKIFSRPKRSPILSRSAPDQTGAHILEPWKICNWSLHVSLILKQEFFYTIYEF
jgi:hypothetical protein